MTYYKNSTRTPPDSEPLPFRTLPLRRIHLAHNEGGEITVTNDNMTRSSNSNYSSHVFELAQAIRLAQSNKERVTKSMANYSQSRRRQIKEHRNKVVSLILDFADGKLEAAARSKGG